MLEQSRFLSSGEEDLDNPKWTIPITIVRAESPNESIFIGLWDPNVW